MKRQKKMLRWLPNPGQERPRLAAAVVVILLLSWIVLGGNKGLWSAWQTWRERAALEAEVAALKAGNAELEQRKRRLSSDPQLYEKVAREDLALSRPGELIYKFDGSDR